MLRRIITIVSYVLLGVAIISATIVLVAVGEGYGYDFKTNQFVLNGLLVINAVPVSGTVYINGKDTRHNVPYRSTMHTGEYDVEIRHDGYVTWHKHIQIHPSQVTDLEALLLIPNSVTSDAVTPAAAVTGLYPSADRKHLAYVAGDTDRGVWVVNPDRKQAAKVYNPPPVPAGAQPSTITGVSWSADGSHLLLTSTTPGAPTRYLLVASNGGTVTDLTDLFKFDLAGIKFSSYDWHELYWLSPEGLRKLNTDAKTVSVPLADKISAYTFAGDRIIYIQSTSLGKVVYSVDRNGNDRRRIVESIADSDTYDLDYANYHGHDMLAVVPRVSQAATLYLDIYGATPTSVVVSKSADHVLFSDDSRYLEFYSTTGFGSYDAEKSQLSLAPKIPGTLSSLSWLDDYHILLSEGGKAAVAEPDGDNLTELVSITDGSLVTSVGDARRVATIHKASDGTSQLFLTELKH